MFFVVVVVVFYDTVAADFPRFISRLVSRRLAAPLLNNLTHLPGLQCRSVTHACGVAVRLQVFSGFVSQTVAAAAVKVANR